MCRPTKRPKAFMAAPLAPVTAEPVDFGTGLETFVFDVKNDDTDFLSLSTEWIDQTPYAAKMEPLSNNTVPIVAPTLTIEDDARPKTFVYTAFDMVSNIKNAPAIGFSEDGMVIEIRDLELLCESVLPAYFRHKNVTSFYRQLNSYGFRTTRSSGTNVVHAFVHELFRSGHEELLGNIFRKKCLKKQARLAAKKDEQGAILSKMEGTDASPPSPASVSSGSSDETHLFVIEEAAAPEKKKFMREPPTQIEVLREAAVKAAEHSAMLESLNQSLRNENRAILSESESIFTSVNQMADAQTSLIALLFGLDAGLAFSEQCKPFRMGGEADVAKGVSMAVQEQARDFESFNEQTSEMLFEDDDLAMLEKIFVADIQV